MASSSSRARRLACPAVLALLLAAGAAQAQDIPAAKLAPGFTSRPAASRLVIIPADMELFSISAGGLQEPRADWTEQAQKNLAAAFAADHAHLGSDIVQLSQAQMEEFEDIQALHRAVASAISMHHLGNLKLPTKNDKLQWSLGAAVRPLKDKTGADYALFTYLRDSYASTERKLTMLGMALFGAFTPGGDQQGYASLVDLNTGRVVWFSGISRSWGDLRDGGAASETVDWLLKDFPEAK
ncbi:hypothetical protein HHL11_17335 [Ramlibacter sp. G-1-2-2]|uniref:DUF4136 domain-containing protein n=1 Tax=Ramlibacter agri TaxID=2728837 RepID=A0A848H7P3_9BURK|nr:hypothetical protein [Ramlibacter agri]NML45519.1 hypothetical protein [Ramlibacter agri]